MVPVGHLRHPRHGDQKNRTGSSASTSASPTSPPTPTAATTAAKPQTRSGTATSGSAKLQAIGTKSAKRLLKKRRRKESRFAADTNHRIAKSIVTEAERTGRGIALEDLGGIRNRVRLRGPQRVTLHSWAFHQLGQYIAYKAKRAAVAVVHVDPAYTSQECSACGYVAKATGATNPPSTASRAASLSTPTGTQPATSPQTVLRAGQPSACRTRRDLMLITTSRHDPQARPFKAEKLTPMNELFARVHTACAAAGRDPPETLALSVAHAAVVGEDDSEVRRLEVYGSDADKVKANALVGTPGSVGCSRMSC